MTAENCLPLGFKYRLYLLHGLMSGHTMKNSLTLQVLVKRPKNETFTEILNLDNYVSNEMETKMEKSKIVETLIACIDSFEIPLQPEIES